VQPSAELADGNPHHGLIIAIRQRNPSRPLGIRKLKCAATGLHSSIGRQLLAGNLFHPHATWSETLKRSDATASPRAKHSRNFVSIVVLELGYNLADTISFLLIIEPISLRLNGLGVGVNVFVLIPQLIFLTLPIVVAG